MKKNKELIGKTITACVGNKYGDWKVCLYPTSYHVVLEENPGPFSKGFVKVKLEDVL